ncbi:MAG: hypothetical protein QOH72_5760 [Solirubrobacteraceae bacterium]|jgi:hypothetical protein|nr:hypothetical protein [Solirubrobacteraceae bacterium]
MPRERGQGTLEYLAVVLLVAVVLGGGATAAAATGAGGDIATAVPHQVLRALCIVTGGDCDRDRAPCDVSSRADSRSWAIGVAVFKVGHDKTVTMTRRSDGTYAVTLDTAPMGGLETSAGARAKIDLGKRTISAGVAITGGVTGSYAHQRTWVLHTKGAVEQLVQAIADGAELPAADVDGHEASVEAGADMSAGTVAAISAGALARLSGGSQIDHATGNRTYFFTAAVSGDATASVTGTKANASASGSDGDRYALTMGPDGRWLDLAVTRTGALAARADLPPQVAPIADALDIPAAGGRRWLTESHLDLTDAENLAAARTLVGAVTDPRHPGAIPAALAGLERRMDDHAVVDARTYAVDRDAFGAEGHIGVELKVGAKYQTSTEQTRLVAATTRGIDGQWRVRHDCLEEAKR